MHRYLIFIPFCAIIHTVINNSRNPDKLERGTEMFTKSLINKLFFTILALALLVFGAAAHAADVRMIPAPQAKPISFEKLITNYRIVSDNCGVGIQCDRFVDQSGREVVKLPIAEAGYVFDGQFLVVNPYDPATASSYVVDRTTYHYRWDGHDFVPVKMTAWPAEKPVVRERQNALKNPAFRAWLDEQAKEAWDKTK